MAFSSKVHTIAGLFYSGMLILGFSACQQDDFHEAQIPDHLLWPRPEIVPVPAEVNGVPEPTGPFPEITESGETFLVEGEAFTITFSKENGLITSGQYKETPLIRSGPFLNIIGVELDNWSLSDMTVVTEDEEAVFHISGSYRAVPEQPRGSNEPVETDPVEIEVDFTIRIDGNGLMTTAYTIGEFPLEAPKTRVVPWNQTNAGGYSEVGVSYLLTDSIDRLAWDRNGLWSIYPEDHIGSNSGVAHRTSTHRLEVGVEPDWSWSLDETNFNLFGVDDTGNRGTNDFRSMKENIYEATALTAEGVGIQALSDGTEAVRLELAGSDTAHSQFPYKQQLATTNKINETNNDHD